jgi:two-component system NtrC family sensor kinase
MKGRVLFPTENLTENGPGPNGERGKKQVLNKALLDALPYPAWLIGKDRRILFSNLKAKAMGGGAGEICRVEKILGKGDTPPAEVDLDGKTWETCRIPIDVEEEIFLHYALDVSGRKVEKSAPERYGKDQGRRVQGSKEEDNAERGRVEEELRYREAFENLVSRISTRFIELPPLRVGEGIRFALEELSSFVGVEGVFVFELTEDLQDIEQCWSLRNGEKVIHTAPCESGAPDLSWFLDEIRNERTVEVVKGSVLPPEAAGFGDFCRSRGIRSILAVPLISSGRVVGALGLKALRDERSWGERERHLLVPLKKIIGNALGGMRAEEALRESEARYGILSRKFQTILDGIQDGLVQISPDFEILWGNSRTATLLGMEEKELLGEKCFNVFCHRDKPCDQCPARETFRTGEAGGTRIQPMGNRTLETRTFPIRDPGGKTGSVIIVIEEVTEKFKFQQETLRTAHLASLGELAAGVAHEVNNPINGIINYAQILADRLSEGSRDRDIAERIIREGDRIASIVRNLLSFARSDNRNRVPVTIKEVLLDALFLVQSQLRKDNITLIVDLDAALPDVVAFPQQLQQVFLNILNNAVYALNEKYSNDEDGKILELKGDRITREQKPFVRITFLDHGTGIPMGLADKILTPFFTTKPVGSGTGLGLSISYNIVANHGGRLHIESEPGQFTRVEIDLPAAAGNRHD